MIRKNLNNQRTDVSHLCAELQELQAQRRATLRMQIRISNGCLAFVRRLLGYRTDMPEKDRNRVAKEAKRIVAGIQWRPDNQNTVANDQPYSDNQTGCVIRAATPFCLQAMRSEEPWKQYRKQLEASMRGKAEQLPIWAKMANVRGFGSLALAIIVGESGDIGNYDNPAKLWKRFGLAVIGGKAQRKVKDIEEAKAMGYNPARRSAVWTIGDSLIKLNDDGYRKCYDCRKEYEHERNEQMTKLHAHRRAKRYMEKRLIRNIWAIWHEIGG